MLAICWLLSGAYEPVYDRTVAIRFEVVRFLVPSVLASQTLSVLQRRSLSVRADIGGSIPYLKSSEWPS